MSMYEPWNTFSMFGSAKTWLRTCNFNLQGRNVSTIQSLSLVLICIRQTIPIYDRMSWCSKSIAISVAALNSASMAERASGLSTKVAGVSSGWKGFGGAFSYVERGYVDFLISCAYGCRYLKPCQLFFLGS